MKKYLLLISIVFFISCAEKEKDAGISFGKHDLVSNSLAKNWDNAIPLGNGIIGALVWQKNDHLRMSLDRSDLWDLRPMQNLNTPDYKFSWVYEQWKNDNYKEVQKQFDAPYDKLPAPSKIPGAILEFDIKKFGKIISSRLSVTDAICEVKWKNGIRFTSFVHASEPVGWFRFEGVDKDFNPILTPPAYNPNQKNNDGTSTAGQNFGLRRLGYPQGKVSEKKNSITYTQEGWGGFTYEVNISWKQKGDILEGCWSISSDFPEWKKTKKASVAAKEELKKGYFNAFNSHKKWWADFWAKSSISIPDSILEKQWYLEQYKFGSAARNGSPPISLQSVWTADNGRLPPWKGDFHHDLNTQLSYWPAYSGNHLDLEMGYLTWLLKNKKAFEKYTKEYFGVDGLAVPGVTTLTGKPMGGWIQYAFGPTVSAWLGQHFYLHWKYTKDRKFLKEKAYPWIRDVALFFDNISVKDKNGMRKLPISSSPEINGNAKEAWFNNTTNFDLANIRWTYEKAAELALELNKKKEAKKWNKILKEWPYFAVDPEEGLMLAPGYKYEESHRHFSHFLAFHPLGIIDYSNGDADRKLIDKTLKNLLKVGSSWYVGYSFSWLANIQARVFDGEGAAKSLRIFADNFCLPNSFHVNGEQHNRGYTKSNYRIFTLEGNFAFAAGLQEMLIQSHTGIVRIFPAIPESWQNVSFNQLRAQGAFLVSAKMENGEVIKVEIISEKGGVLKLKNPFEKNNFKCNTEYKMLDNTIVISTTIEQKIEIVAK